MSFYHVILTFEESPHRPKCIFWDLSKGKLNSLFVKPYRRGKDIFCDSEVLRLESIQKIQIIETDQKNEVERIAIQVKSQKENEDLNRMGGAMVIGMGRGYHNEDIVEAGEDVTKIFIDGAPGYAAQNVMGRFLGNPWVQGVGVTLIGAFLIWKLGW